MCSEQRESEVVGPRPITLEDEDSRFECECAMEELSRRRNETGVQRVDRDERQQTSLDVCADEWFEEIKP